MSNLINKAKDALSGHKDHSTTTGTTHGGAGAYDDPRSTNAGPHSSNIANTADPRVDSSHTGTHTGGIGGNHSSGIGGTHSGTHTGGIGGTHTGAHTGGIGGNTGAGYGPTGTSTNAGPHNSNLLNKADPRIDSDRDNRNNPVSNVGGYGTQTHGGSGLTGGGSGLTGTHGTGHSTHQTTTGTGIGGTHGSTNAGPHDSNLANKLDPRVSNNPSSTQQTHGGSGLTGGSGGIGHGTTGHTATHGTHGAGTHGVGSTTSGSTTAAGLPSTQAAAHSNATMNKIDPRVKTDSQGNPAY